MSMLYLIRPAEVNELTQADTFNDPSLMNTPLEGPVFTQDNRELYSIVDSLTQKGPGESIVLKYKTTMNGRAAYLDLDNHFSGGPFKTLRVRKALQVVGSLKYTGTNSNFSFENYRRKYADAYRDLKDADQEKKEQTKVLEFIENIKAPELQQAVLAVYSRDDLLKSFDQTATYLSGIAVRHTKEPEKSQRSAMSIDTRKRSFDEWRALSHQQRKAITKARQEELAKKGNNTNKQPPKSFRDKCKWMAEEDSKSPNKGKQSGFKGGRDKKQNGRMVAVVDTDAEDDNEEEVVSSDDDGLLVSAFKSKGDSRKGTTKKKVRFHKAVMRCIRSVVVGEPGQAELDTHADNCLFGKDARVLEEYNDVFNVCGYRCEDGIDMKLMKIAVAYDFPSENERAGETVVMIFDQSFYDPSLQSSLINPNQLREHGIIVEDTPIRYDQRSTHSIYVEDICIPLKVKGAISYFNIRPPTDDELVNCKTYEMTGQVWNPESTDHEEAEEAARSRSISAVDINLRKYTPSSPYIIQLSKLWQIPQERVFETINATTVYASKTYDEPRYGRYGHKFRWLSRKQLSISFYTDTFFAQQSRAGNTCAQLFISKERFIYCVPMKSKGDAPQALKLFIDDVGIPETIVSDNAPELKSKRWKKYMNMYGIKSRQVHTYSPWQNHAENGVRIVKFRCLKLIETLNIPLVLWDHLLDYVCTLNNKTCHTLLRLQGRTPHEAIIGSTPDISSLVEFAFYDWVWYIRPGEAFPGTKRYLGRWLGPSKQVSSDLSMKVLTYKGKILHTAYVQPVKPEEKETVGVKVYIDKVDKGLQDALTSPLTIDDLNLQDILPIKNEESIPDHASKSIAVVSSHKRSNVSSFTSTRPLANTVTEEVFNTCDDDGCQIMKVEEIIDHYRRKDITPSNTSTDGWYFLIRWSNQDVNVVRLADIKESHPIQVADYAKAHSLDHLPGMSWWVPFTLKHRDKVLKVISKTKTVKKHEKFGIRIPRTVSEAYTIDKQNGNYLWAKAIDKEMTNASVAFDILPKNKRPNPGYKFIRCHMIFDIKVDLTRKARFVAGGHLTECSKELSYSTVVSRDSIRILLLVASLNGLNVLSTDIQNAYLSAQPREKVYFTAGPEFRENEGRTVVIVRALYGLKSSGAAFRSQLSEDIRSWGYAQSKADADVYLRPRSNGIDSYYEYICVYVDDIIVISHNPEEFMKKLSEAYNLKNGYASPTSYLGMELDKGDNGCWSIFSRKYIENVMMDLVPRLKDLHINIPTNCPTPLPSAYRADLDSTKLLDKSSITLYQGIIGILRWLVEIGRIDISYATSVLSSYLVSPRMGHLLVAVHVLGYLRKTNNSSLSLNDEYPNLEFIQPVDIERWREFYPEAVEFIPLDTPKPLGRPIVMSAFVDADHAGDSQTRRSHTGIILYLNKAPVVWISKKQPTVETSSYGSELVAMRICVEAIEALRYKCRAFGIPIDGPTNVFCDNQSVVFSATTPESSLKKKHNSVAYHKVREAAAAGIILVTKVMSGENLADLLTKNLSGAKTRFFSGAILCVPRVCAHVPKS